MTDQPNLERLYDDARAALAAKDFNRASDLLRQILKADVDYKNAAQLLARVIQLSRRRWYNDPRLWGALGVLLLVGLGIYFFPKLQGLYTQPAPSPINLPTGTPNPTVAPPATATATATLLSTSILIPLTWKRVSMGQEFERDTVTAFVTDKNDPDVIYAAMMNAGVYKTIDGGVSWQPAHQGISNTQVESMFIDSQNPRILYAGTLGGIFKTEDGGENWFRIGDGTNLLMDIQNNSHLYARDKNGIYETTDQGNTWINIYTLRKDCPNAINSWTIHPNNGNMLFLGSTQRCAGVYQSTDGGHNWTFIGLEGKPTNIITIGLGEQGNFSIYTFSDSPIEAENGIYVSHNRGLNWSFTQGMGGTILTTDSDNPTMIYCGGNGLFVTKKKGDTWQQIPDTQSKAYSAIHIDHPNGTDRIITSGTDTSTHHPYVSIFISVDGGASWVERINGIGSAWSELRIDPMDNAKMFLSTYYENLYGPTNMGCTLHRSQDNGKSWSSIKVRANWCGPTFDAIDAGYLIEQRALQKFWDDGEKWLWTWSGIEGTTEYNKMIAYRLPAGSQSISANPNIEGLIYVASNTNAIYYSANAGASWQLSAGSAGSWDARFFYADQSKIIYAIGRYHQSYSTDNGKTWKSCGEEITTSRSDTRLALDLQGSRLYLATPGQGVLISTDNCRSWQPSNIGLSNLFVNTLAIDPNNPDTLYAGTDGGAYISYDSGATWGQINDGLLGATVVYSIAVDSESNVYATTPYGIFKLENK